MTVSLDRAMPGLAAVASALNDDDLCRARIAAVHLRLPDLPDVLARIDMQLEDIDLSLDRLDKTTAAGDWRSGGGWNPDEHPRTGTPPNPGWFAPKDGGGEGDASAHPTLISDETNDDGRLHLPPGDRNDEIGDLLEWIASAKPGDAQAISNEIKRVFFDAGDFNDGAMFQHALAEVLRNPDQATRQQVLDTYEPITHHDPTAIGQTNSWLDDAPLGHFPLPDFLAPGSRTAESAEGVRIVPF